MVERLRVTGRILMLAVVCAVVFAVASPAFAASRNDECTSCHQADNTDWTVGNVTAPGGVNRDTACVKCHTTGLYGTHPRHYAGGNCGAICHASFGPSSQFAIPRWVGAQGSFASSSSVVASASLIHVIHAQKTWMGTASKQSEACASCHAVADCAACHEYTSVSAYHQQHSATGDASWTAQAPWTGTTAHGVIGGDLTMKTDWEVTNQCATAGCHSISRMAGSAPVQRETHSHSPVPASPVTDVVTVSPGPWKPLSSTNYTAGRTIYMNTAGYTVSNTFDAQVVEVVTDLDPYRGMAEVWIDGVNKATIDCYAPTTQYQKVVYRSEVLGAGAHTVMIKVLGTKNPSSRGTWVFADGFRAYTTVLDYAAPKCITCHPGQDATHGFTYSHVVTSTAFTAGTYRGFACTACHEGLMTEEHRRTSSKVAASNCAACHTTYAPKVSPTAIVGCTSVFQAPGCHQATQTPHNAADTTHTPDTSIASEAKCRSCHAGNLDIVHDNSIIMNATVPDCLSCHGRNTAPGKSCTAGCHVTTGVDSMETHPYPWDAHAGSGNDAGVINTGGYSCGQCHDGNLDLGSEHARSTSRMSDGNPANCSTCHDLSYLPASWDATCVTCHSGGAQAPVPHSGYAVKHDYSVYAATNNSSCGLGAGVSCHNVTQAHLIHNNNAADGRNGTCASCHVAGSTSAPTQLLCTNCHTAHNLATPHQSGSYGASTQCLRCHDGFSDINTAHPSCATCHSNPTLVDYIQDNYTAACTDCHSSGAGKLGKVYTPADPAHYTGTESTHTASGAQAGALYDYDNGGSAYTGRRCDACHSMEMKPEHITKTYTNFAGVPSTYPDKCVACHEQKVDGLPGGVWNDTCAACHTTQHTGVAAAHNAGATILASKAGSPTAGASCGTAGCHDVANIQAIHNNSVTSNDGGGAAYVTTCVNTCHSAAPSQAKKACDAVGCHFGMADHNADHAPAANVQCGACHESADVKTVHGGASACAVCHANPVYPGITTTNTASCGDGACHNASGIGRKSYALPDAHYVGEEASHTSSGNGTYSGYACTQCHLLEMKPEHAKASASFAATTTAIGKCVVCHESKVDNFTLAWDKKCASCHPATHGQRSTKHNASASGCGPSKAAGCHDVLEVGTIHNNSITTNAMLPSCATCHNSSTSVPATTDCNTAGCHLNMVHTHSLNLTGSNYNNTTVTGCTNSGIGCHGSQATSPTPDYAGVYHPATGCTDGRCHKVTPGGAANPSQTDAAFNNPNMCQNCHGGRSTAPLNYDGAPDVINLQSPTTSATGGHYNETAHTIVSVVTTMSVGGASTATCVTCHQHTNPYGIDGEWYQHQALQTYGNTTCYDCHSYVTQGDIQGVSRIGNVIQNALATSTDVDCVDCHNAVIMGVEFAIHETTSSPPATATVMSTVGFQCGDSGCHAATGLEIHELHKGDGKIVPFQRWNGSVYTTYTASRCDIACHNYVAPATMSNLTTTTACERRPEPQCVDCHDPLVQGRKPLEKSCGVNGDCHITSPHSQMGPAHSVTALSAACIECHETTDMRGNHGYANDETCGGVGSNNVCHNLEGTVYTYNSVQYTFTLKGKKECKDCHALGKMPGVTRDHAPHDPNHYVGSETTHTAINQTGTFGSIYSVVATESFTGGATWPASWTRSSTTTVSSTAIAPTYGQILNSAAVLRNAYFQRTFDVANVSSPTVEFKFTTGSFTGDDNAKLEYSTDGVVFTTAWTQAATQATWTSVGPIAVPRSTTLTLRFSANTNSSAFFRVDDIVLKPGDAIGAGCFLTCHYSEMKPEHFKFSADATRVPAIYSDKCIDCHENRADAFDVTRKFNDWDRTCVQCHGTAKHYSQTLKHDASTVRPDCGGSGCHYLKDVAVIHNNSALGNAWPTDPAQSCTVCHQSKQNAPAPPPGYESYSALDCGLPGCHFGVEAHAHELDYDASLFNATTVTGCIQSGAGCHGNLTGTNYAADYHAATGCLSGNCHNAGATNHSDPAFDGVLSCTDCHGGGTLYVPATDRIPVTGASPDGHYPETNHTGASGSRTASVTGGAGGTITARCNQCHNDVNPSGSDGLYYQHTGVSGSITNVTCVDCHNGNVGTTAVVTSDWLTRTCTECHNASVLPSYVAHNSGIAPVVNGTEAQGAATCAKTGCHTSLNLHDLHKGSASTPATRSALGCAFTGCHDYTKQGKKPTLKSCGAGGACHTTDTHDLNAAHAIVDTANCTRCHEGTGGTPATRIDFVYKSSGFGSAALAHTDCNTCHNPTLSLPTSTDCINCHKNGTAGYTHDFTPYDPSHYYAASHDASQATGRNFGTSLYGSTLSDFHGTSFSYERGCTTCHTIDLKTEHAKTSVAFNLGGAADKCVACHENKVDNWSARWAGSCSGEANSCHNDASLHDAWNTKHDASASVMTTPGVSFVGGSMDTSTQVFATSPLPVDGWTTTDTVKVKITTTDTAVSGSNAVLWVPNLTTFGYNITKTYSTAGYESANITFKYKRSGSTTADYIACWYSTNGTTWTQLVRFTTNATTWTQAGTYNLPISPTLRVRFIGFCNAAAEYNKIDDIKVTMTSSGGFGAELPAGSTAAASCMNNPNGTECHNVADVADIHSRTVNNGCPICHTGTAQNPTNLNCQSAGCHVNVNLNNHNTAWHESPFGSNTTGVFTGTGIAANWCRGCHDDSIDNEHFVFDAYSAAPCSTCHRKSGDSGAPTNVTSANTSATIHGDSTANNELCEDCHKTITGSSTSSGTAVSVHIARSGPTTPGATTYVAGGIQWSPTWSGHRSMSSMPGQKSSFMPIPDGVTARRTWSLVTATSFLKAGWTATSMVTCADCHGDVTGSTGPHGATMSVKMVAGYDTSYQDGTLSLNGTNMSNTTNLCAKCHTTTMGYNNTHSTGDHSGEMCRVCHVRVPHGWKRPRLIGYTSDPAPYATMTNGIDHIKEKNYTPTGWLEADCDANCTSSHPAQTTGFWK